MLIKLFSSDDDEDADSFDIDENNRIDAGQSGVNGHQKYDCERYVQGLIWCMQVRIWFAVNFFFAQFPFFADVQ